MSFCYSIWHQFRQTNNYQLLYLTSSIYFQSAAVIGRRNINSQPALLVGSNTNRTALISELKIKNMTNYLKQSELKIGVLLLTILLLGNFQASAQKKKGGFLGEITQGIKDLKEGAKEITGATKEITNTVKSVKQLKQTWSQDPNQNIKYKQNPDYRNREEVTIEKNQKLTLERGEFKNFQWTPLTYFQKEVFPSFIIGWSLYQGTKNEDMGSSLGFNLNNNLSKTIALKWEIECDDKNYFDLDSGYINIGSKQNLKFMPKIAWRYKTLTKHQTSAPINISFRLIDPLTGNKVEKNETINLRSINDCIRFYNNQDFRFMYAAYVNEDHPEIDKILGEALKTKMVNSFSGYQSGSKEVALQIAAIWRVLNERGFKYSSITNNSGINDDDPTKFSSQSIRTFDNAIKTNQANCVDGTVVFASILKKIGIVPIIITVPGHCFLGYYTDETLTNKAFLETTMLSSETVISNPSKYLNLPEIKKAIQNNLPKDLKLSDKNKCYYLEFLLARISASDTYKENVDGGKKVNEFNVSELRKNIKPIPVYY
jgi:hypothetical protein